MSHLETINNPYRETSRIRKLTILPVPQEIPLGVELPIEFSYEPADADNIDRIEWRCSPDICHVRTCRDGVALIKGLKEGNADLTLSAEGVSDTVHITVRQTGLSSELK